MDINTYNKTKENVEKQLNDPQKLKTYIKPKLSKTAVKPLALAMGI